MTIATTLLQALQYFLTVHPFTVLLVATALVAATVLALLVVPRRRGLRRPRHAEAGLRALHRDQPAPAIMTGRAGQVIWANAAAERKGLRLRTPFAEAITAAYDVDLARLYRLHRIAEERGLALAALADRHSLQRRYLTGQSLDGQSLLWTIQRAEEVAPDAILERDIAFEAADIAHAAVAPDGRISTNGRFAALFAVRPKSVLEQLPADHAPEGGRLLLPVSADREAVFRVFAMSGPAEGRRDYLFFPSSENREAPPGASAVLDRLPLALLQLDIEGRVVWANSRARTLLGDRLTPGRPLAEVVEPLARPMSAIVATALRGLESTREMVRLPGDGTDTFLQVSLTRAQLDEHDALFAVLTDASQIRQLEDQFAQSQKMEAVGKLAGGIAHDFNNVLTAISGHTDLLLLGKEISDPDYSDLTQIRQNANRAATLVRQLLAFSRKQTLSLQRLSLSEVISDALYLLDRLIGGNVTLKLRHARDLGVVRADQQQLEQALMNLVVNARDAMPQGGTVTIATRNRSLATDTRIDTMLVPAGDYVEVAVEDEGPGIPPHVLPRLFEPFFTTKAVDEGTGLGLSTVYGIVKQSGGVLTASNRESGGARFRILLPRLQVEEPPEAAPAALEAPAAGRADLTGRGVVLLVEDEAPVRAFASRALSLRGYRVKVAESAEQGMAYLSEPENPVDVIISDVVMPGMDGPAFATEARRLRPGLPVIFVSGYAEESFRKGLIKDDFLFLAKPFSLSELAAKVKDALENRPRAAG